MKKLLEFLVTSIVNHPEEVKIEEIVENDIRNFIIHAHTEDLKTIIGKKGRTIRAIRELLRIKAFKLNQKFNIKIED